MPVVKWTFTGSIIGLGGFVSTLRGKYTTEGCTALLPKRHLSVITRLILFSSAWVSVQFCGEDSGTSGQHNQTAAGGDWSQDLRAGQGIYERQNEGNALCFFMHTCRIWVTSSHQTSVLDLRWTPCLVGSQLLWLCRIIKACINVNPGAAACCAPVIDTFRTAL